MKCFVLTVFSPPPLIRCCLIGLSFKIALQVEWDLFVLKQGETFCEKGIGRHLVSSVSLILCCVSVTNQMFKISFIVFFPSVGFCVASGQLYGSTLKKVLP